MTQKDLVQFWNDGSDEAWKTVQALMQSKRHLHALFFCHLALEKLLKAKYVAKHNTASPPVHHLQWLAQNELYKKADESYAMQWITSTEALFRTIRQQ